MPLRDYQDPQALTPDNILEPTYRTGYRAADPISQYQSGSTGIETLLQLLQQTQQQTFQRNALASGGGATGGGGATTGGGDAMNLIRKYFPQDQWDNAYRVMMGESSGRPDAVGDKYEINGVYAPSYGLFQIRGLPGRPPPEQLLNPEFNVQYAAQMWQKQGWGPWTAARKLGIVK